MASHSGTSYTLILPLAIALVSSAAVRAANFNHFGTGGDPNSFFAVDGPGTLPAGDLVVRGTYSLADHPLYCVSPSGQRAPAVDTSHLFAPGLAWGITEDLQVSAGLPVQLLRARLSERRNPACGTVGGIDGLLFGLGDPDVAFRLSFLSWKGIHVAAKTAVRLPAGLLLAHQYEHFLFNDLLGSAEAGLTAGTTLGPVELALEGALNVRPRATPLAAVRVGQELTFGAGAQLALVADLLVTAEVAGRISEVNRAGAVLAEYQVPLEALAGVKYRAPNFEVALGAGGGLAPGYGTPRARVVLTVSYALGAGYPDRDPALDFKPPRIRRTTIHRPDEGPPEPEPDCEPSDGPDAQLFVAPGCPEPDLGELDEFDEPDVEILVDDCRSCAPKVLHDKEVWVVVHLFFAHDEAALLPAERARLLRESVAVPPGHELTRVVIQGHADASGHDDYNVDLSRRRGERVRDALSAIGVPGRLVELQYLGEADHLVPSGADDANRRVRVLFVYSRSEEAE